MQPLDVLVTNGHGEIVGGLIADTYWGWLEIDDLWVAQKRRGQGIARQLMALAETEARARGCTRVFLRTFSFQARGFYEKLGYQVVGELVDYPPGEVYYWMPQHPYNPFLKI